ncbi:hypothetical protein BDDG_05405 [Blastomyces dermatitidis ATCC 18188]|uniref:Uncharacterized protein n=1 Tax=Ajellomyces dermatitidis (strain ATCC 18188 / CBS 674.68) TaxID=653446 RepID=F2TGU8_AJEDA|nr:hypothetical protein BDDG_05405 [Blastomyces dermatitidis ATCC 18188]
MPVNTRLINCEETSENQTTAPEFFSTLITVRKSPHNNNNQDNDNITDEAAVLRQCITQMNEELYQIRASSNSTTTATVNDDNDLSSDLAAYLQNHEDISVLSRVLQEFCECKFNDISATAIYDDFNYLFIEYLLTICIEYICLEYANIPNFIFFDKLLNSLTKKWSTFIRDCMNYAAKNDNITSLEDDFLDLCRDILLRLLLNDKNARNDTKNNKDAIKNVKDNKNIKKKCTACKMKDHDESSC